MIAAGAKPVRCVVRQAASTNKDSMSVSIVAPTVTTTAGRAESPAALMIGKAMSVCDAISEPTSSAETGE